MEHPLAGLWRTGLLVCLLCDEEHVGVWPADQVPGCPYCENGVCIGREEVMA